ncbi:MAG: dephospho-CoA kinase [Bryobacteraceae bacterium]|nr:dephospho-CoA kinase [Solibacteraceae bacterium]MCL4842913.1 dephospho-CoA kinase [Bryobacteraceae bacterium]MCO5351619.1 dephospho-CoA kinase [Bryobacteraceae bacterium]
MLRVGLTGGLATGKTFVGRALANLGCHLLQADELGHAALEPGGGAYQGAIEAFGLEILDDGGRIDRRRLGLRVFASPEDLARLNALVHPVVIAQQQTWFEELERRDPRAIGVVEAAILIETGSYRRFSKLILTVCEPDQQIERAMKRDGLSREEVLRRLDRQMPLDEKRRYADYVIDTSGDKAGTLDQVARLYALLRSHEP